MKRSLLLLTACIAGLATNAQPWMDQNAGKRATLEQITESYNAQKESEEEPELYDIVKDNQEIEEEGDYHFRRWLFYWEGRTDKDGHPVSTRKHWEELQKLKTQQAGDRAAAKTTANDANWTFHGPTNAFSGSFGLGRINVIEFHPTDTNTYMIGSPGGGLWRTTDDGNTWTPLNDFFPVLGISDIDYNPLNPSTIYVCTGDRDAGNTYSMGVFKSLDGGATWDTTGFQYPFKQTDQTTGLVINPIDTNSLTLATTTGMYKSYDAGTTWTMKASGSYHQLVYNPADTNIIYAAGSSNGGLYRTTDGGATWTLDTAITGVRRIEIAVTPANPAIVKFVAAKNDNGLKGIYHSSDSGKTFVQLFNDGNNCSSNILANTPKGNKCGGQGWYDLTIQISPVNPTHVVVGGVNTWYSTDGGSSWHLSNQWANAVTGVTVAHADKHCHKFHPLKPGELYECNDGGIYKSAGPMSSNSLWTTLTSGLGITEYYRIAVEDNASFVLGGAQDNGSRKITGVTSNILTGGDGMDCQIDPSNSNTLYTSYQYGALQRSVNGGQNFTNIQRNIPGRPKGAWVTPFVVSHTSSNVLQAGYRKVYLSTDYGDSWTAISPDFGSNISRLAITPKDGNYTYALISSTYSHTVKYTTDGGTNWKSIPPGSISQASDIMVDPNNKDSIWVTYRTYTGKKVGLRDIKGSTWQHFDNGLPEVPVNCITYDKTNKTYYIGTDLGVYYREDYQNSWHYFNNKTLPNVEVFDLGVNQTTQTLWAATYGRGMWSTPLHKSTLGIANTVPMAPDVITIAPNPNYGVFDIKTNNPELKGKTTGIRIINMTGRTVWQNNITIDNSGKTKINADLPRGTYLVEVVHQNIVFAKSKMVVF